MADEKLAAAMRQIVGDGNVRTKEPMKLHTTFKIGGAADYFVTPKSTEDIRNLTGLLRRASVPFFIMGNGSNLLVSDTGYRGVVIQLGESFSGLEPVRDIGCSAAEQANAVCLRAQAGALLSRIGKEAAENSLTGFEFAAGIPGTLGGAVMMNAGAYGGEMKDVLKEVCVLDPEGRCRDLPAEELKLGYRTSILTSKDWIVLSAVLALRPGNQEEIKGRMKELAARRREKQPLNYPSAGSTFKRPAGHFAGKLITDAGLRGYTVGGAQVSEKHAGFVVNLGTATAEDVLRLTETVSARVREQFGVSLELEVKKLGFE